MKVLKSASGLIILAMTTLFISNYWVRPLADDYCLGANVHTFGTLGAISNYFQTWSGDAALIIALVYLVGMPLTLIGTTGYAFLPFVLAFFAITSLIMFLLKGIVLNRIKSILAAILLYCCDAILCSSRQGVFRE
jgi:L-asparagine transporter-like permease